MGQLKILHVITTLDPRAGGPPAVALRLGSAQAAAGCEVHVASYHAPDAQREIDAEFNRIPHSGLIRQHYLSPSTGMRKLWASTARRALAALIPSMHVVHIHGVWDSILKAAADVSAQAGVKYVVAPHGMLDPWSLEQRSLKKRAALFLGYRRTLDRAAFLHALNTDEQRLIGPLGLRCPAVVIPNGVFREELEPLPAPGTFRASHPQLGQRPYLLFLGRLHFKKGLDYLADAFQTLARGGPDLMLVVAGPDGGEQGPFQRRIESANLTDRVRIVGPLYGKEKFAAMVDAACFCLPSRQEGFSMAVTEAMACGLPVVISDACHFPEVADVGAGEVVPLDAEAIARAIQRILDDSAARMRMSEAAKKLVFERYLWPAIAQRSIAAYEAAGIGSSGN